MNKIEYKKILTDLRNSYIDYIKLLNIRQSQLIEKSYDVQKEYLNNITFSLISKDNIILSNIGSIIAYKILKKRVNKDLTDLTVYYMIDYNDISIELKKANDYLKRINITIDFINSVNNDELDNYLIYKIK